MRMIDARLWDYLQATLGGLWNLWVRFRITLDLLSAVNNFCEGRLAWNLLLVGVFNAYSRHFFDATSRMIFLNG